MSQILFRHPILIKDVNKVDLLGWMRN
jgi:hypothetical protein